TMTMPALLSVPVVMEPHDSSTVEVKGSLVPPDPPLPGSYETQPRAPKQTPPPSRPSPPLPPPRMSRKGVPGVEGGDSKPEPVPPPRSGGLVYGAVVFIDDDASVSMFWRVTLMTLSSPSLVTAVTS